jgi:hypothetical protein
MQKPVKGFAVLQKIYEALHRNPRTPEAGSSGHALRSHPDRLVEAPFLFGSHDFNLDDPS